MDVLILAAGLSSRLSKYTHNLIPKYLIDIDGNTGLYYLIKYWNNYATNIYLVIHSKYNVITKFYINNILPDYVEKIKIINYDSSDGTAYTINHILNNDLKDANIKNLLITWCDLYPNKTINFKKINKKDKANEVNKSTKENKNNIFIFTHGSQCRFGLNESNEIFQCENCDGNIIGIYYFQNYTKFVLDNSCLNTDIVSYLNIIGSVNNYNIEDITDYGDEDKLLKILEDKKINNKLKCRYFNSIDIIDDNKLLKKGIDDKGKQIIFYEKEWYKYINNLNNEKINNFIPKIYNNYEYAFLMEYKKDHIPLYQYFLKIEDDIKNLCNNDLTIKRADYNIKKISILKNIIDKINILHNTEKKTVSKIIFLNDIKKEIYDKVYDRVKIINPIIEYFGVIKKVNNINILSFDKVIEKCKNIITKYYNLLDKYEYSIIFGDCQFSNILINPDSINDILFIDPRGYFGNTNIHGLPEYDYAKVLYAISGYDSFNNNFFNLESIDIENNSLEFTINGIFYEREIINKYFNKVHKAFLVIIWLSLSEYSKNNIWKCISSYYYGLYLGTLL